jgi:multiple sugar transport system substrate-binding protein
LGATAAFVAERPDVTVSWEARSLQDFADFSLEDLARRHDLIVFDHPFVGEAAAGGLLAPLDRLLPKARLADSAANSTGPSHASYAWGGHQWALAIDAACHVSARRADLLEDAPPDWDQVLEHGRRTRRTGAPRIALPAVPIDAFLAFMTLLANRTGEPFGADGGLADHDAAGEALERLGELLAVAHPASLESNPIQLLDLMTTGDDVAYLPITFGYVNYATPGEGPAGERPRPVVFGPIAGGPAGSGGGVLGGAGLGVSALSRRPAEAAAVAAFVASAPTQAGQYAASGGQPGHRAAWLDPGLDQRSGGFFSATLPCLESAWLRPRWPGYIAAQTTAAEMVHDWLTAQGPRDTGSVARLTRRLDTGFRQAHAESVRGAR